MSDSTPPPDPSPYQPPAPIDEAENRLAYPEGGKPPEPLPTWASAAFAVVAGASSTVLAINSSSSSTSWLVPALLLSPLLLLTLFVLLCLYFYSSQPLLGSRALGWKILITVLAPPASLLVFVPTCVGSTLLVFSIASSELLLVLPLAVAYFFSAQGISRWLWRWFASASTRN